MGIVVQFPRVRDRRYIQKQASFLAGQRPDVAEKHLRAAIKVQRDTMQRRGIAPEAIDEQLRAVELAIRAALWSEVLTPGGAA